MFKMPFLRSLAFENIIGRSKTKPQGPNNRVHETRLVSFQEDTSAQDIYLQRSDFFEGA